MLPIDADLAMSRWNAKFFDRDNVMPSAIVNLKSNDPDTPVNPADVEEFKAELKQNYAASERRTYVTSASGGVDVATLGWSMRDMDFDVGRNKSRQEIFEILGIPEGLTSKNATEANATVGERIFKNNVWTRTLVPIAEQVTLQVIIPFYGEDQEAVFTDIRIANRELELAEVDRAKGALTIDEVRKRYYHEGPLPDGAGMALFSGAVAMPTQVQLLNPFNDRAENNGSGNATNNGGEIDGDDVVPPDPPKVKQPKAIIIQDLYSSTMAAFFLPPESSAIL